MLQFWSLAVEEQFYLVWPLTLGGLFLVTRRLDHAPPDPRASGSSSSSARSRRPRGRCRSGTPTPNRAYYGTDTRAYELLAGALLALTPGVRAQQVQRFGRSLRVATWLGIGALVVARHPRGPPRRRSSAASRSRSITCALIVAIEAVDGGLVKRALSSSTVVYLGKISYGTYLWHWLVILVIVRALRTQARSRRSASRSSSRPRSPSLSFEILERPVRMSALLDRHRRAVIAVGPRDQRRVGARDHPADRRPGARVDEVDRDAGAAAAHPDPAHARLDGRGPLLPQLLQPAGERSARS